MTTTSTITSSTQIRLAKRNIRRFAPDPRCSLDVLFY
jgi:hypothetical protein